jgi:hypothetical protein
MIVADSLDDGFAHNPWAFVALMAVVLGAFALIAWVNR